MASVFFSNHIPLPLSFFRVIRQLHAAEGARLLHVPLNQLIHARLMKAVAALQDLHAAAQTFQANGALSLLLLCCYSSLRRGFFCRRRCCRCTALLWRHAVLLVPALFPVTLLALDTAVVRDLAPAADAVSRTSGDGAAVVRHLVVLFQICLG